MRHGVDPYYINGQNSTHSNWMKLVNTARHEGKQNVIAYQYLGNIYYRTVKSISPASELLGDCEKQYTKKLGTDTNTEGKLFLRFIVLCYYKFYFQFQLPILIALAVENRLPL